MLCVFVCTVVPKEVQFVSCIFLEVGRQTSIRQDRNIALRHVLSKYVAYINYEHPGNTMNLERREPSPCKAYIERLSTIGLMS